MVTEPDVDVPGYPADLERVAVLADGRHVRIRPIRPGDEALLRRALAAADPETLHARFLGAPPHDNAGVRRLLEVDYHYRLALVAFAPDGTGAGVARYAARPGSSAEVAVAVDPGWRRVGLATLLLRDLGVAASRRGIDQFTALILADNASVTSLVRASGLPHAITIHSGTADVVMSLPKPPHQPAEDS